MLCPNQGDLKKEGKNMKGSVGTSTTIVRLKFKKKNKRKAKSNSYYCYNCKSYIKKGQWMTYTSNGTYRHTYKCPEE